MLLNLTRTLLVLSFISTTCFLAACQSGDPDYSNMTETERLRREAPPQVGRFLISGQEAYDSGVYNYALAMTDSAEKYMPGLADVAFLRGKIYTEMNQLEIANTAFDVALEQDPKYPGANFSKGQNSFRRGQLREALDYFDKEKEIGETSGLWRETGRIYAQLGEPDSAATAYERSIQIDSTNTAAIMWLGQLYEDKGELEKALEVSKKGLAIQPDNPNYKYILGTILNRLDRPEEAQEYLEDVAGQRPWHHGAQYNLAQVYSQLGMESKAKTYYDRAEDAQQHQQEINEAQTDINRDPNKLEHWIKLADLHRKSNQLDRTVEAYKVAVSLEPGNLHLQSNLAGAILEMGEPKDAIRRFRAILGVDPNIADVWVNMGVAQAQLGLKSQAQKSWDSALKVDPGNRAAKNFLSKIDQIKKAS